MNVVQDKTLMFMKKDNITSILLCLFLVPLLYSTPINHVVSAATDYQLTIYTYQSLLNEPVPYDLIGAFSNYSGIPKEEIQLLRLDDSNTILSRAILEKDNPTADVLIGLDNILIFKAINESILEPYHSPVLSNISSSLIENLDPNHYLLPYDYGVIALWVDTHRLNISTVPELDSLTLEDILDLDLDKKMVVENPIFSSPGLGFLLWTIAVLGDSSLDISGLLESDWRDWWEEANKDLRIASSWSEAFDIWYSEEADRPIMISYGTSPAYSACLYDDYSAVAYLTHENSSDNSWLQIEGLGLVNGAPNEENAKMFIDWFLSKELQDQIATHNWMYPANKYAEVPECFANSAINPDTVDILNNLIPLETLENNLDFWLDEWEEIFAGEIPFPGLVITFSALFVTAFIYLRKKKQ